MPVLRCEPDHDFRCLSRAVRHTTTGSVHPDNLVAAILFGLERSRCQQVPTPRFDKDSRVNPPSDAQIADIANYVLGRVGNPVSAHR